MTECVDIAFGYTQNKRKDLSKRPLSTIFVNEVLESEKLKVLKFKTILGFDTDEELYQFHKHHHEKSPQPNETDYKKDTLGRRYRNVPFTTGKHRMDEYVARDSVTIPRYLIVF